MFNSLKQKLQNNNLMYIIVFFVFVISTFVIGINHEPWADEAQSWLIARDCSFYDILFNVAKYEGSGFLWFFLLKIVILLGLKYKFLFVVSWLISTISIYLFIFKSRLAIIIKLFFVFSFFIFYQYSIIARPYCLVFFILSLVAIIYQYRLEKKYLYSLLLILLASICAYSVVITIILLLFFFVDIYLRDKTIYPNLFFKYFPVLIVGIYLFIFYILFNKPKDCTFTANFHFDKDSFFTFFVLLIECYYKLSESFIIICIQLFLIAFFYFLSIKLFCKNITQILFFCCINFSLYCTFSILYYDQHHLGIPIIALLFSYWILSTENKEIDFSFRKNQLFCVLFIFIFSFQIYYSYKATVFDIKKIYSSGKDVALFLKEKDLENKKIIGIGYDCVSVQPYFKRNIFLNWCTSYWNWKEDLLVKYNVYTKKYFHETDVIVITSALNNIDISIEKNLYDIFFFYSRRFNKNNKIKMIEPEPSIIVYVKK